MAFLQMNYRSNAMNGEVAVNVILPEKAKNSLDISEGGVCPYRTLYLLHGIAGDHAIWMRKSAIERYAESYNVAVVMPGVGRSWYTDTAYGAKYLTFVAEELPLVCRSYFRGMSDQREDTFVAGLSMGGYGAVKVALTHPETFCGCGSLSGALDISDDTRDRPIDEWRGIAGFDLNSVAELKDTKHDVFALAKQLIEAGKPFPKLYMWCGEQDTLLAQNDRFHAHLNDLGVEHLYETSEGDHSWRWWDLHVQDAMKYLLEK